MKNRINRIAKQTTAWVSSLLVAVQPVFAQSIVADGNGPDVLRTNNGIDMVMIETPNAAGVSINTFDQFNVAEQGAILNNIRGNYGITNLGGFVQGNSNVSGGTANLIINQVTSNNPSELLGYLEVGGAQANVVIANAYGITCDGCGFINTDHVALTTGSLTYDQGRLDRIQVTNGAIQIGERGADARGVSQFDLIARKVDFAGSVQGQRVLVIAGQNDVIFATGAYEAREGDGSSVGEYAIDSTVFGGMYANKITIVSTEQGAGVRAPNTLSSSTQGMTITADGRLVIGTAASSGSISGRSNSGSVVVQKTVQSQEPLSLQAKQDLILEADAFIVTEATANLTAERDVRMGASAQVLADTLSISADDTLRLAENAGLMSYRDIGISGGAVDVADGAMIYAGFAGEGEAAQIGDLSFNLSGDASFESARLFSTGSMGFEADDITITGDAIDPARFVSLGALDIDARSLTTSGARLEAAGNVDVALQSGLNAGSVTTIISSGSLAISAAEMSIVGTALQSGTNTDLTATGTITGSSSQILAQTELSLQAAAASIEGTLASVTDRIVAQSTSGALTIDGTVAAQTSVELDADGTLTLAGDLQTAGAVNLQGASVASSADIVATGDVTATALSGDLTNSGAVQTGGDLVATATGQTTNTGALTANGALTLQGGTELSTSGALQSGGLASLSSSGDVTNNSDIASNTGITISSGGNLTSSGDFATLGDLTMTADGALTNSGGSATAGQATAVNVTLNGGSVTNSGDLMASNDMALRSTTGALNNTGNLIAGRDLSLTGQTDLNTQGTLAAGRDVDLASVTGDLTSSSAIQAQGAATLNAGRDLQATGAIVATGAITETAARDLVNEGNLQSATSLTLQAGRDLTNSGGLLTNGAVALTGVGAVTNSGGGLATGGASGTSLTITGDSINQSGGFVAQNNIQLDAQSGGLSVGGDLTAGGLLDLDAQGTLSTTSVLRSGGAFTADANRIELGGLAVGNTTVDLTAGAGGLTQSGQLLANGTVDFTTTGDATISGTVQSATADINVAGVDVTTSGTIIAVTDLDVVATGDLTLGGTVAANNTLTANGGTVSLSGTATGVDALTITSTSGNLSVMGTAQSNGAVTFTSTDDLTLGTAATVKSTGDSVTLTAADTATLAGYIRAFNNVSVTADALTQGSDLQAGLLATLTADTVQQTGDILAAGLIANATTSFSNTGTITAQTNVITGALTNSGALNGNSLNINATSINNAASGTVSTNGSQVITTTGAFTNAGDWAANVNASLTIGTALTNSGTLDAGGILNVAAQDVNNTGLGTIEAGSMLFDVSNQITNAGVINSEGTAIFEAELGLQNTGTMQAAGQLQINTASLTNSGDVDAFGGALLIDGLQSLNNAGGTLSSDTGVRLRLNGAINPSTTLGTIQSDDWVTLEGLNGGYLNALTLTASDEIVAQGNLSIKAESVSNAGTIASALGNLNVQAQTDITNTGLIYAGGDWMSLRAGGDVVNDGGTILAANNLVVCGVSSANCLADLSGDRAGSLTNRNGGVIETINGDMYLAAVSILNQRDGPATIEENGPVNTVVNNDPGGCSGICLGNDSYNYTIDRISTSSRLVTVNGTSSSIVAGGDITLNAGSIDNSYSLISADENIAIAAGTLTNYGEESTSTVTTITENWRFIDRTWPRSNVRRLQSTDAPVVDQTIHAIYPGTVEAGGNITGSVTDTAINGGVSQNDADLLGGIANMPSLASTAQTASQTSLRGFVAPTNPTAEALNALVDSNIANQSVVGGSTGAGLSLPTDVSGLIISPSSFGGVGATDPSGGSVQVPDGIVGTLDLSPLSNGQLFGINPDPMSGYLVETRPEFINLDNFVSSDYFLESLNFDPDITQTRFGDALAETYLIRNQIFDLTGRRILTAGLDEREQMRLMYDNAIDAASLLGLRPGVSLTPAQIAALTTDIIWLEERVVSGQTVLVPQVYLVASGGSNSFAAATITGQNVSLNVGSLNNQGGAIIAREDLVITAANDITNGFGQITSGDRLVLSSLDGDIRNLSGQISGGDVSLFANNIFNETQLVRIGENGNFTDVAGQTASISATGQLDLQALNDITVTGATLTAGTGIDVFAGGNIDFAALLLERQIDIDSGEYTYEGLDRTNLVIGIEVTDGSLTITSAAFDDQGQLVGGGDIIFEGTDIAASGAIDVNTFGGNVILGAARDVSYSDSFGAGGNFLSSYVEREETLSVAHNVTDLSGGSISIYGAGQVYDQSTNFETSDGNLRVEAGAGDVLFGSVTDIEASNSYSETTYLGGLFDFSREEQSLKTTALETTTDIRGDVALLAGGDLEFQGGDFNATGTLSTDVGGETRILATVDTDFSDVEDHYNNGFLVVDTTETTVTQEADFTRFNAEGGTAIDNGSAVTFGLDAEQSVVGTSATQLVGVQDGGDPTQDMAITDSFLPDATGSPEDRLADLTSNPLVDALAANQSAADTDEGAQIASAAPTDPRYDFAGSAVALDLPSGADDPGFAYIDELTARDTTVVTDMSLIDHHFQDEQVQLGVLGQLAVTYLTGQIMGGFSFADGVVGQVQQAAAQAAISGTMEGVITGNFDIENLLTDVAFAGVSSLATGSINIDGLSTDSLFGIEGGQFSVSGIANSALDSTITAGLSTAVYGGDFGDNLAGALQGGLVNLAMADVQTVIGDNFAGGANGGEGSFGHAVSHAVVGCAAGELMGGDCGASAAAAATSAFMAGVVDGSDLELEEKQALQNEAELFAGLAGALVSGGDSQATQVASNVGGSAFQNNYLTHANREALLSEIRNCEAESGGGEGSCDRAHEIIEKYKVISTRNERELSIKCGSNVVCVNNELNQVATTGWDDLIVNYANDYRDLQDAILPGETIANYQNALREGSDNFGDQFVRNACGGNYDAACVELERELQLKSAPAKAGAIIAVAGVVLLAPEAAAACLASPMCRAGLAAAEMADLSSCAASGDPLCVVPGPNPRRADELKDTLVTARNGDSVVATNRTVGGTNVRNVDASVANSAHDLPPYNPNRPIRDFEADGTTTYVRVYTEGSTNQGGRWMMSADDIAGLSPQQIKDKFDLPYAPTHVTDVKPPQGTTIRTGTVNSGNFGGNGGGTQFELQGRIPDDSFSNPRSIQ